MSTLRVAASARVLRRFVPAAAFLLFAICLPASRSGSQRDASRWGWLADDGGTYWYVPSANLQAFRWDTDAPQAAEAIDDQTVWHIQRYENGYFFGPVVVKFAGFPRQCEYLIGSVTPEGRVYTTFNPLQAIPEERRR